MLNLTVEQVANMLGWTPTTLMSAMRRVGLSFGVAIPPDENHQRYQYRFFPGKVRDFVGEERFREGLEL